MASAAPGEVESLESARARLQALFEQMRQLAAEPLEPPEFDQKWLALVVEGLAAVGGAVWRPDRADGLQATATVNVNLAGLTEHDEDRARHEAVLRAVFRSGEPALVAPRDEAALGDNPTPYLLVLAPIRWLDGVAAVVEIFGRPGAPPAAQRGYLRFLMEACGWAEEFERRQRARQVERRAARLQELADFTRRVHADISSRQVAYALANEGRRALACDRVSVAVRRGTRCRLEAVSGQDVVDLRGETARRLTRLVQRVVASGETLDYTGETSHLPPQIEQALVDYVDESHTKALRVVPLARQAADDKPHSKPRVVGALVVEQIEDTSPRPELPARLETVAEQGAAALANALEHEQLFLLPLWRLLGKSQWLLSAGVWPKTAAVAAAVVALLIALVVVPADFQLHGRGTLLPVERRDVFAAIDGTVERIHVRHGQRVSAGQLLLELRNTDLDVALADVAGQATATREQLLAVDRALFDEGKRIGIEERNRLAGQRAELKQKLASLDQQLALYREKQKLLAVVSPIDGEITTWNVEQLLANRPVRQGQALLNVADTSRAWEIELRMPEDRLGHVLQAAADNQGQPLRVTYRLATEPGVDRTGRTRDIELAAEVRGEEGNTVLIQVALDDDRLPGCRAGADVVAKVDCGRRALGYVWLHDAWAFLQKKILFRLG